MCTSVPFGWSPNRCMHQVNRHCPMQSHSSNTGRDGDTDSDRVQAADTNPTTPQVRTTLPGKKTFVCAQCGVLPIASFTRWDLRTRRRRCRTCKQRASRDWTRTHPWQTAFKRFQQRFQRHFPHSPMRWSWKVHGQAILQRYQQIEAAKSKQPALDLAHLQLSWAPGTKAPTEVDELTFQVRTTQSLGN